MHGLKGRNRKNSLPISSRHYCTIINLSPPIEALLVCFPGMFKGLVRVGGAGLGHEVPVQ